MKNKRERKMMDYLEIIHPDILAADNIIKELFFKMTPLYRTENGEMQDVTVPLFTSLHSTSESVFVLLLNHAVFDADVLLRTIMEGTIKYCYLMTGEKEARIKKYEEYKTVLPDIYKLRDHRKAKETIEIVKLYSKNDIRPFLLSILDEETIEKLSKKYSKNEIKQIENQWSYRAILKYLGNIYPDEYAAQWGTLYTYSFSSHIAHFDWDGVGARAESMQNSITEDGDIADITHAFRIISNVLSMELFRVMEYMRCNKYHDTVVANLCIKGLEYLQTLDTKANELLDIIFLEYPY